MRILNVIGALLAVSINVQCALVSPCVQGEKRALAGVCNRYLLCDNSTWHEKLCPEITQSFDQRTGTCRKAWEVPCEEAPKMCLERGQRMQVPGDCSGYFECLKEGHMTRGRCPWFQRFDVTTSSCRWWYEVDCRKHAECTSSLKFPMAESSQGYRECVEGKFVGKYCGDGTFFDFGKNECVRGEFSGDECENGSVRPVPGNCREFYRCDNGRLVKDKCWFFQAFDPQSLSCSLSIGVNCSRGSECKTGDKAPSGNCREFYQCEYGFWKRRECGMSLGLPLYFDENSKNCMLVGGQCSSAECSIEGLKTDLPTDCSKYRVCRGGHFFEESCGRLQKYDSENNECRYVGVDCSTEQDYPVCFGDERRPIDGTCYSYEQCVDGHFETRYCLYPIFRFHKATRSCSFMSDCETTCYERELKPVHNKCNQFYICLNGAYQLQTCPDTNVFDVVTSACRDPQYATCASTTPKPQ